MSVSFRGGLFRGVNKWNMLIPFEYGELVVDDATHEVRCRLSFRQLIVATTIMLGFIGAIAWYAASYNPVVPVLVFGMVGCGWLAVT